MDDEFSLTRILVLQGGARYPASGIGAQNIGLTQYRWKHNTHYYSSIQAKWYNPTLTHQKNLAERGVDGLLLDRVQRLVYEGIDF